MTQKMIDAFVKRLTSFPSGSKGAAPGMAKMGGVGAGMGEVPGQQPKVGRPKPKENQQPQLQQQQQQKPPEIDEEEVIKNTINTVAAIGAFVGGS